MVQPPLTPSQRLNFIRNVLRCPLLLPTIYAAGREDKKRSSSKLDPDQVAKNVAPNKLKKERAATMVEPLHNALREWLSARDFPDHLLHDGSIVRLCHDEVAQDADRIAPGETGISHFLKSSLFDQINRFCSKRYPQEDRFWRVIGVGGSGKTDWGFYVNGILRVVVELKPHIVSLSEAASPKAMLISGLTNARS